jgi:hypothetical protein
MTLKTPYKKLAEKLSQKLSPPKSKWVGRFGHYHSSSRMPSGSIWKKSSNQLAQNATSRAAAKIRNNLSSSLHSGGSGALGKRLFISSSTLRMEDSFMAFDQVVINENKAMWQGRDKVWHFKKPCFSVPIPTTEIQSSVANLRSDIEPYVREDLDTQSQHRTADSK